MTQATPEQLRSIQPDSHVWVMASAGSGKTHVLSERVLRLLLEGEPPESILCLTYTKAAAAEMSARVFRRLSAMVHMDAPALNAALQALGVAPERAELARTLFARTLDARGGLKIQTIHAFCQSLLARFPLEAELPPGFGTLDDLTARQWLRTALDAELAAAQSDESVQADWAHLAATRSDSSLMAEISAYVDALDDSAMADLRLRSAIAPHIRAALELPRDGTAEDWLRTALDGGALDDLLLADVAATWSRKPTSTLLKRLDAIAAWRAAQTPAALKAVLAAFSDSKGLPLGEKAATQGDSGRHDPEIQAKAGRLHAQLSALNDRLVLFTLADNTAALARLCWSIVQQIRTLKQQQGLVDFGDLIAQAGRLMQDPKARWVLYMMDDRIRHILVDEAQDTNAAQWRIIDTIAAEYFDGEGAAKAGRTIFAVGDDKQSIYGFQGAEPRIFDAKRREYETKSAGIEARFERVPLSRSFRSSPAVIDFVNASMTEAGAARFGLAQDADQHVAHRRDALGQVCVWDALDADAAEKLIEDVEDDLMAPWRPAAEQMLAFRIADQITDWLEGRVPLAVHERGQPPRQVMAGDIMILVQKRSALMTTLVSALKSRGIAVAGVDRIALMRQIAVRDVCAAVAFAIQPEDDLNLACLLKAPFLAFSEESLMNLCLARGTASLWSALRDSVAPDHVAAADWLASLLARADLMRVSDFLSALLDAPEGRARLVARLGEEVLDPLSMLMDAALRYEREQVPSLQGFLHWLGTQSQDIKRDADQARGQVRLMTVHGAKGLEAPVVILADATTAGRGARTILSVNGVPIWYQRREFVRGPVAAAVAAQKAREEEEYWRLYYVAITRAADHLFITGWRSKRAGRGQSWHDMAQQSVAAMGAEARTDDRWGQLWRIGEDAPDVPVTIADMADVLPPQRVPTPIIKALPEPRAARPLTPSRLAEAAEPPMPLTAANADARLRGIALHRLFESLPELPPSRWPQTAAALLRSLGVPDEQRDVLAQQAIALMQDAACAPLFSGDALAEVPVSALLPDGTLLSGQIDRLLLRDEEILILDYKTGQQVPARAEDAPAAYLRQMAAYRWALQRIWTRPVRAALLWTAAPLLMPLPDALLDVCLPEPLRS